MLFACFVLGSILLVACQGSSSISPAQTVTAPDSTGDCGALTVFKLQQGPRVGQTVCVALTAASQQGEAAAYYLPPDQYVGTRKDGVCPPPYVLAESKYHRLCLLAER